MSFADRIAAYRERVDLALERWLPPAATHPERFHTAIRYSVLGGGKRVRPLLAYATAEWLGLAPQRVDGISVAIELIHAYSLVHDDLPAMADDDLRRGRATTHIAFDEATAILVGDALQAHAYYVLAADAGLAAAAEIRRRLLVDLAEASGSEGMAGGQAMAMAASEGSITPAGVEDLYARKTGRLLRAAVVMPCRLRPDLGAAHVEAADRFGRAVGLAFQVAEDLLDIESAAAITGKPRGSDARTHKVTLPALLGVEATRRRLDALRAEGVAALSGCGAEADGLRWICDWAVSRDR